MHCCRWSHTLAQLARHVRVCAVLIAENDRSVAGVRCELLDAPQHLTHALCLHHSQGGLRVMVYKLRRCCVVERCMHLQDDEARQLSARKNLVEVDKRLGSVTRGPAARGTDTWESGTM